MPTHDLIIKRLEFDLVNIGRDRAAHLDRIAEHEASVAEYRRRIAKCNELEAGTRAALAVLDPDA